MGQYWKVVNLDRKEFVDPHKLGCGLKLWEQIANHPGTGTALLILTAAMPEIRGGGDLDLNEKPVSYHALAQRTIGRWAGDRIAVVGDYAEREDLPSEYDADLIYDLCTTEKDQAEQVAWFRNKLQEADTDETLKVQYAEKANRLEAAQLYKDISDDVCAVIEHELHGKFQGEGWREFITSH
jgi:hypothetical protein